MYITKINNCQLINLAICVTTEDKMSAVCWGTSHFGTSHFGIFLRLTETQLDVKLTTKSKLIYPVDDRVDI